MGKEIERKFLVQGIEWKKSNCAAFYRQGYLSSRKGCTVRVRTVNDKGFLTVKGEAVGLTRDEYEYEIPLVDANEILVNLCGKPLIEKRRYKIPQGNLTWEIDEFLGENEGLIVAEIELPEENTKFCKPSWVGDEVTGDPKYFNSNLAKNPFKNWK